MHFDNTDGKVISMGFTLAKQISWTVQSTIVEVWAVDETPAPNQTVSGPKTRQSRA